MRDCTAALNHATAGSAKLRELGINTIINLRGASARTRAQEAEARALGLNYFNVALPNWGRPQDTRVQRILEIIAAPENGRVFIHCRTGVDRTGTIVALYRMTHEGWSSNDALAEAERNGMRRIQFWMRDYAEDYGEHIAKTGPETALKSPRADEDFGDRIGAGMRIMERETFRARKVAGPLSAQVLCFSSIKPTPAQTGQGSRRVIRLRTCRLQLVLTAL